MKIIQPIILLLLLVVGPLGMKPAQSETVPPELPSRIEKGPQSTAPASSEDDIVLPESTAATELKAAETIRQEEDTKTTTVDCAPVKAAPSKVKDVKLTDKEAAKVSCSCEAVKPKVITKTKTKTVYVDNPIYIDRQVVKTVTKTKPVNVYIDRPVTQTVDRIVKETVAPHHAVTLMVGRGPDGLYPVLEKRPDQYNAYNKEYKLYKAYGVFGGVMYQYYFGETFGVGGGFLTNDTYMGTGSVRW